MIKIFDRYFTVRNWKKKFESLCQANEDLQKMLLSKESEVRGNLEDAQRYRKHSSELERDIVKLEERIKEQLSEIQELKNTYVRERDSKGRFVKKQ